MHILIKTFIKEFLLYPVYCNLSYLWNFGVLSFFCLLVQIFSGIFLAMFYIASIDLAFLSIENIMRNINYGWLVRYIHANGASLFFLFVYLHLLRNLYFNSYFCPREFVWILGMVILVVMIITAFLGYVLPWGQMSFWAATVITSLFSAVPIFGNEIVIWLWGGYAVDQATLNRFFSFHYLLPFILIGLVVLHVMVLHFSGSTNPLGIVLKDDKIFFHPYYTWKDILSIVYFFLFFFYFIYYQPNLLSHPDNYIMANSLVTPAHIVPEWYFLPFYAILRSIPNKLGGILLLIAAIFILICLPFVILNKLRSIIYRFFYLFLFCCFMLISFYLGWLGGEVIEYPFLQLSQLVTLSYFLYFIFFVNFVQLFDYNYLRFFFIFFKI